MQVTDTVHCTDTETHVLNVLSVLLTFPHVRLEPYLLALPLHFWVISLVLLTGELSSIHVFVECTSGCAPRLLLTLGVVFIHFMYFFTSKTRYRFRKFYRR